MTIKAMTDILKAHLIKEGLVLCKASDTQFPLDGMKELDTLRAMVELVDDLGAVPEWLEDAPTAPIPSDVLTVLTVSTTGMA